MKRIALFFYIFFTVYGFSQVGINTITPSEASVLEVKSSSNNIDFGGFMPPKVSQAERDAIPVSASDDGLMIYLIEGTTRCLQIYDAVEAQWENAYCMPVNAAPIASAVTVTGCLVVGEDLTFSYSYSDAEGDLEGASTFQWYRAVDASGTGAVAISGATNTTYTVSALDTGVFIAVEVTPMALTGTVMGAPVVSSYEGAVAGTGTCGPVLLGIQDFEVVPATPTLTLVELTAGTYQTGTGSFPNSNKYVSPVRGYGVTNSNCDIDLGPVDASSYTSATVFVRLASFAGTSGNGADTGDYADIYISTDGGTTYSYEMEVTGSGNAKWDFNATGNAILTYDGDNIATSFASPNGTTGITTLEINGLPNSSNLVIGIVLNNDSSNETWVIDDVEVYGN
ncbi:MAG: hypothetical protein R2776_07475 [Flavobacteriaceae bacterium]|nr:hypothetical protein [Flavobacteriaceae bacterium]